MKIDFAKYSDGLVPAVIQDHVTHKVLMLGFMNQQALDKTMTEGKVTFYSRSKKPLMDKRRGEWQLSPSKGNRC